MQNILKKGILFTCFMLMFSLFATQSASAASVRIVKVEVVNSAKLKATLSNKKVQYINLPVRSKLVHGQDYVYINFNKATKKYKLAKPFTSPSFLNAVAKLKALETTRLEYPTDIPGAELKSENADYAIYLIKDASKYQINALYNRKELMDMNIEGHGILFEGKDGVNALNAMPLTTLTQVEAFYTKYNENSSLILDAYDYTDNYNLPVLEAKLDRLDGQNDKVVENKSTTILSVVKEATVLETTKIDSTKDRITFKINSTNEDLLDSLLLVPVVDNVQNFSTIELSTKYLKSQESETPGVLAIIDVTRHASQELRFDLFAGQTNLMKLDAKLYHVVVPVAGSEAPITLTPDTTLPTYVTDILNTNNDLLKNVFSMMP
jgi:hypothetical protein